MTAPENTSEVASTNAGQSFARLPGSVPRIELAWCMSVKNPKVAHLCICRKMKAAALCGNNPGKWRLSYNVGYCAECLDRAEKIKNFPLPTQPRTSLLETEGRERPEGVSAALRVALNDPS